MKEIQNKIITILGKKGTGKTTLAKELILKSDKPVLIWDFLGEYTGTLIATDLFQLKKAVEQVIIKKKKETILVRMSTASFPVVASIVYEIGNFLFVIEEASAICNPQYIPEELSFNYRYGRHKGIDLLATSQRPAEINRLLTSQSDLIYVFKFVEPLDIKYIKSIDHTYNPETLKKFAYHIIDTRQ